MAKNQIYNLVRNYHVSVEEFHEKHADNKDNLVDLVNSFLDNEVVRERLQDKESEDFDDFETVVMTHLKNLIDHLKNDDSSALYETTLKNYIKVLKEFNKDD